MMLVNVMESVLYSEEDILSVCSYRHGYPDASAFQGDNLIN